MLDRGELKDWFHSSEIWLEATVSGLGFYLFTAVTTDPSEARIGEIPEGNQDDNFSTLAQERLTPLVY
jgi:hypothetical protein